MPHPPQQPQPRRWSSADPNPPPDLTPINSLARREDRLVAHTAAPSLSDRVSRQHATHAMRPKRMRGASYHSESTPSLAQLATPNPTPNPLEQPHDSSPPMPRSHRRRASESSYFTQRPKRPHPEQNPSSSPSHTAPKKKCPLTLAEFELSKVLGSGGTATVIRAEPKHGTRAASIIKGEVALKVVQRMGLSRRAHHYLIREIGIHRHVQQHANIVSLYEVFGDSSAIYLAMELLRGSDLYSVLKKERTGLSEPVALTIMAQVLEALQFMHSQGYAHRDIKPENVMFTEKPSLSEGRVSTVKLIDFGLAWARDPNAMEKNRTSSEKCGTVRYAAPEIVTEPSYVPEFCDIWSVGIVLYSIIAHRNPYAGKSEKEVLHQIQHTTLAFEGPAWQGVSDETKNVIRQCLNLKPSQRPTAATCLAQVYGILETLSKTPNQTPDAKQGVADVSGFSSHVTPEGASRQGASQEAVSTENSGGTEGQGGNFFDGLFRAIFNGGSSPGGSDNST